MIDKELYFYRHKWCVPVKGVNRGTINDFERNSVKLVPNFLCDILINYSGRKINEVYEDFVKNQDDEHTIDEYFQFLIEEEFVFLSKIFDSDLDNEMSSANFEFPQKVYSSIIDYDKKSIYSLKSVINQLNLLGAQSVQIRFFDHFSYDFIDDVLKQTNNTTLRNVELVLKYVNIEWEKQLKNNIEENYRRVSQVFFHSYSKKDKNNHNEVGGVSYFYSNNYINDCNSCGTINPMFFDTNPFTYLIGKNFNTCLYKKISIDVNGLIKNCPSMVESFGNISETRLEEVVLKDELMKFWNVTKDKIDDCKNCEFRLVCTDCRAYLNKDSLFDKPAKCNYDIYASQWTS